jgi:hypothetical protein
MEKGTFSFTHEELKQTADVLRDNADWLESEFKDKEEPLNLSIICIVCNEDTGQARSTTIGKSSDIATSLASVHDSEAWGRVLMQAALMATRIGPQDEE